MLDQRGSLPSAAEKAELPGLNYFGFFGFPGAVAVGGLPGVVGFPGVEELVWVQSPCFERAHQLGFSGGGASQIRTDPMS